MWLIHCVLICSRPLWLDCFNGARIISRVYRSTLDNNTVGKCTRINFVQRLAMDTTDLELCKEICMRAHARTLRRSSLSILELSRRARHTVYTRIVFFCRVTLYTQTSLDLVHVSCTVSKVIMKKGAVTVPLTSMLFT